MERFFMENSDFLPLKSVFVQNGITEENFYDIGDEIVYSLIKDHPNLIMGFIAKYQFEKGKRSPLLMDIDFLQLVENEDQLSADTSAASHVSEEVDFIENDLFRFLNHPDNLEGRIILGKYRKTKIVDETKLKRVWLIHTLKEDTNSYSIKAEKFVEFTTQAKVLFPNIDTTLLYIPYTRGANGNPVSARGGAYTGYKYWRNELRNAGMLVADDDDDDVGELNESILQDRNDSSSNSLAAVTSDASKTYELAVLIREWEASYQGRIEFLKKKVGKRCIDRTSAYLKTFPCLSLPSCISVLETDFHKISQALVEKGQVSQDIVDRYDRIFSSTWPSIAFKVVDACKHSKIKEIKELFKLYGVRDVKENCDYTVLALRLLAIAITVPKQVKTGPNETYSFQKHEISDAFILFISEPRNVESKISEHQQWLEEKKQVVFPFLAFVGDHKNVLNSYVIINSVKHDFPDPVKAVEACYKCLVALLKFPHLTEHLWEFIRNSVYKAPVQRSVIPLTKFLAKVVSN